MAVEQLVERLDVARERDEGVAMHQDFYGVDLGSGVQLYSVLFEPDCPVRLGHDDSFQLQLALDHADNFDDSILAEYEAEIAGSVRLAPGVAWAHAQCSGEHQAAVLPLPLPNAPHGPLPVSVKDAATEIFFVTNESEHVGFFRSVITLENAEEEAFERLAPSTFPALDWADDVWRGLEDFDRPYITVRDQLVQCLGGLSDHGATCFHEHAGRSELPDVLSVKVGYPTSDENGETKRHPPSRRDRTRRCQGTDMVFWWHVKLQPHVDRIYFRHELHSRDDTQAGRVIVGIFKDHCVLP